MNHLYQSLASKIRKNFYERKKQEIYSFPMLSTQNRKEKFAKLFLQEIQKNSLLKFSSPTLPVLKGKEKWRKLYKEFHLSAKNGMLAQNFSNALYPQETRKSMDLFPSNTRSLILALYWYLKKENLHCLLKNYQYLSHLFKKKNFYLVEMSPLLKIKYKKKDKTYFFHHGLGCLEQDVFQKIIFSCLENKKKIFPLLLLEKKFIQFCRYTDNYSSREAEGFFINLKIPLQKIYAKYFSHHPQLPAIRWANSFNCSRLASYNFLEDKITVSPVFDLPQADSELIEYLLYHEMLHRELGFKISREKIYVHTKEFKKKEAQIFDLKKMDKKIKNYLNLA